MIAAISLVFAATQAQALPGVFTYDRAAPLAVTQDSIEETPTLRIAHVSFVSPAGGRVTGILAAPKAPGRRAAVVLLHGAPGSAKAVMPNYGLPLAELGVVVLSLDAPFARRGGDVIDFTVRDSVEQVQLIRELQRAVDVLVMRPDVDSARIGFVGGSYGGAMGTLFAAVERRLKAVALFVPDGGLVAHFTSSNGPLAPLADLPAAQRDRWLAAMRPIEPIQFAHLAAPTPILFQNAKQDAMVSVDDAEALHAAARDPKTVMWYESGHGLTRQATRDRHSWLVDKLRVP